jgi:hypothetical protein
MNFFRAFICLWTQNLWLAFHIFSMLVVSIWFVTWSQYSGLSHDHKKLHKSVQVHLLYYVVGAECISLYLGLTKIQQSRLVVFIALWIPRNPGLVAPSMHATSAPTTVCTLAWLVDFIVFFGCGTHNSWSSCIYTFYVCFVVVEVDNICIDRWICKSLLVKIVCCCSKSA